MCLSIPCRVMSIEGETARVSIGGSLIEANLRLVENIKPGDYVLVHSGFALQKISDQEAQETLKYLKIAGIVKEDS